MSPVLDPGLEEIGRPKRYPRGTLLFSAGEPGQGFHYVRSGEIRVFRMDEKGREIELVRVGPGDFVGEAVVFASASYPAFAQAARSSETLYFEKNAVLAGIRRNPDVAAFFLGLLARKCLVLNDRLEDIGLQTVRQRLVRHLLSSCSGERCCEVVLDRKKADLARLLGTIGETLSRTLAQLEKEGLIEVRGRRIRILDCRKLRSGLES
jgi:CRP/FNR family cyclic AMP-dependent transcriptional regulator